MLARTRQDVDALNARARTAAQEAGQLTGQIVTVGGRDWQAGDLLRTRRNDRQIGVGDGHVRNGDRYRVLGPGPDNGLIVEDMAGRGRTILPAAYLGEHADYGWASTIDAAQGATTDIGIVLVRPGLDREHLYVGLTRGRQANHAYITPDPLAGDDDTHHQPRRAASRTTSSDRDVTATHEEHAAMGEATKVLATALTQIGAQDAAHTALSQARRAAENRQVLAEIERRNAAGDAARARLAAAPLSEAHRRAAEQLTALTNQRDALASERCELEQRLRAANTDLASCPRWARARKHDLTRAITTSQTGLQRTQATYMDLKKRIIGLTAVVDGSASRIHRASRPGTARRANHGQDHRRTTRTGCATPARWTGRKSQRAGHAHIVQPGSRSP